MTAKFRNTISMLALKENGMNNVDLRQNEETGKVTAYFYASKEDLDEHQNILCHCYVTEDAVNAMKDKKLKKIYLTECSQDDGKTWVPVLCVGAGVTGQKGKSILQLAL